MTTFLNRLIAYLTGTDEHSDPEVQVARARRRYEAWVRLPKSERLRMNGVETMS